MLTPAQQEIRRRGLGSSDVGAVAGLSPYAGPLDVYIVKRGLAEVPETDAMRIGTALEPVIADLYAREHEAPGEAVKTPAEMWGPRALHGILVHPTEPWALASPDRVVSAADQRHTPARLVEIKSVAWRSAHHWGEAHDDVPAWYRAQVAWQMAVTGVGVCDLVALIGGAELRVYRIEHDPDLAAMLFDVGRAFWRRVERGEEPPVDESETWRRHLEGRFVRAAGGLLAATREAEEIATRLADARARRAAAEADADRAANELRAVIGEHEGVVGEGWKATWKAPAKGAAAWKEIAMELGAEGRPEVIARHTAAPSRRFTFTDRRG